MWKGFGELSDISGSSQLCKRLCPSVMQESKSVKTRISAQTSAPDRDEIVTPDQLFTRVGSDQTFFVFS